MQCPAEEYIQTMTVRRWGRVLMYFGLTASGIFSSIRPPDLVQENVALFVAYAWGGLLVFSSTGALYGAITDRWIGEYAFLPLLVAALTFFGLAVGHSAYERDSMAVFAYSMTILAFASGLAARWRDVQMIKSQAVSLGKREE